MAFIQPCFIRKNTPELRKKLEKLGYEPNWHIKKYPDTWHGIGVFTNSIYYDLGKNELKNYTPKEHYEGKHFIDCGTNEELFLALAALRDDTNENQWFIMDVGAYTNINVGDWFIATDMNGGKRIGMQIEPTYCHKATVEEIIKRFKDR